MWDIIEAISVTSEYTQDGGWVYCRDGYHIDARLQDYMVHCILHIIGCVMFDACYAEWEYPPVGGRGKKSDGLVVRI